SDLTDFPLLISIIDSDLKTRAQADGRDIAFFDSLGNQLDHEIEKYDPDYSGSEAELLAWIKSDLSSTSDTIITMKYGDSSIANQWNPTGVWSNGYNNIWHLKEDPSTQQIDDSTTSNDGTSVGSMTSGDQVAGQIGGSLDFDGSNDLINFGVINTNAWSAMTVSAWVYKYDTGDDRIFSIAPSTFVNDSRITIAATSDRFFTRIGTDGSGGSLSTTVAASGSFTPNTWQHVTATWDSSSSQIVLYVDGAPAISVAKGGTSIRDHSAQEAVIANVNLAENRYYYGIIDEVRLSTSARSADWVATEYSNQNNPSGFYSVGSEFSLQFEDPVDLSSTDVDAEMSTGSHSSFGNLRAKDGVFNTYTEGIESTNTHSIDASGTSWVIVGNGLSSWGVTQGTISFWIEFDVLAGRPWGESGNFEMRISGTQLQLDWGEGSSILSSTSLTTGSWYFVAITWNEITDDLKMYIGDENNAPWLDSQNLAWTGSTTAQIPLIVGNNFMASRGGINPVDGRGDDLRFWDIERSLVDLQSDYDHSISGSETNLRSSFRFDNSFLDDGPDGNDASSGGVTSFSTDVNPSYIISDAGLDQELQWTTVPYTTTSAELAIYTGVTGAEDIVVEVWNGAQWDSLLSDLTPNSWNNISVASYIISSNFTIRFTDGTPGADALDSWQIDVALLHYLNYQLDWEHQVQSVNTIKENFILTIFGSSSDNTDDFEVQMWNETTSTWTQSFSGPQSKIGQTAQWYNYTLSGNGVIGSTITWRYIGDNETADHIQTTLIIDYAGIATYNDPPIITTSPGDYQYPEGASNNVLTWVATDATADTYQVFREGSPVDSGGWTSGGDINVTVDGLTKGVYNYTIVVQDQSGVQTSDTIFVTVVDTTDPEFTYTPNDFSFETSSSGNEIDWIVTDNYPGLYWIYRNGSQVDTDSWFSGTNITYSPDGLLNGIYNFTIEVADASNNIINDTVWVTVFDSSDPQINSPPDTTYAEGSVGNSINWTATDLQPATYEVSNGTGIIDSGIWSTGVPIVVNIDGYLKGTHDFTITFYDTTNNFVSDTIRLTVMDETPPNVSSPPDVQYSEGQTGNFINWTISDNYPDILTIYKEGVPLFTVPWTSGDIDINVDFLGLGIYNYTIEVRDKSNNYEFDTVLVTVIDTTDPVISSPPDDITYPEGSSGNRIDWVGFDLHPNTYSVYQNESFVESGFWISSATISIDIDGLAVVPFGYRYTIVLTDTTGRETNDTVFVKVTKDSVFLDVPADVFYIIGDTGNEL
ncbi:MAG: LamG-like jellyroll fold domain-containing protein, partial [Candidatus Kariarchaeaceae archaeon]